MIAKRPCAILLLFFFGLLSVTVSAQKRYSTWRWEFIFESATPKTNNEATAVRFSGFFNLGHFSHYNPSPFWGLYWGLGVRNTGFSLYYDKLYIKETRRVYTVGIPLAFKVGNMTKLRYLFAGGEIEFPFHYKQKRYQFDVKNAVYSEWFSNRTPWYLPSVFVGYQAGENLQFYVRYYCGSFLNRNYKGVDFGDAVNYADMDNYQIFNFAVCFTGVNRLLKKYRKEEKKPHDVIISGL